GMEARLVVNPGVVQLAVEQRALEALDDLELRIEPRLDRELPQEALAEGVDGLGAEGVDAGQLLAAGAAPLVPPIVRHDKERARRAGRPGHGLVVKTRLELRQR